MEFLVTYFKHRFGIALHQCHDIDCTCKGYEYGKDHTDNDDKNTYLYVSVPALILYHPITYFQYFCESPLRVTDRVTGILKPSSPLMVVFTVTVTDIT